MSLLLSSALVSCHYISVFVNPGHIHLIPAPKAPIYPFQGTSAQALSQIVYIYPSNASLKKIIQSSMSWFPTVKVSPIELRFFLSFSHSIYYEV